LPLDTAAAATGPPAVTFVPFDASFGQHGVVKQPAGSALRPERMLGAPDGRILIAGLPASSQSTSGSCD
jgi:hypothetical protein